MVIELRTSPRKVASVLLLACLTILSAWLIASPWAASSAIPALPNDPDLLRSWRSHPANPQYQHQHLARIRQYSVAFQDYQEALNQYRMALRENPLSSRTWFDVAMIHWWQGQAKEAKEAVYLLDGRRYGATEELVGDHDWSELKTSFLTSPRAQAIVVRIRREESQKLDNLIAGTAWIDQVYIKEIH